MLAFVSKAHLISIAIAAVGGFVLSKLSPVVRKGMTVVRERIDRLKNPVERAVIKGGVNALFAAADQHRKAIEQTAEDLHVPASTVHETVGMLLDDGKKSGLYYRVWTVGDAAPTIVPAKPVNPPAPSSPVAPGPAAPVSTDPSLNLIPPTIGPEIVPSTLTQ